MTSFKKQFLIPAMALLTLTSCATLLEGSSQKVKFVGVGAEDIRCKLTTNNELAYNVEPPEDIWLKRSRLDMTADCWAPGNRHKVFHIPTSLEPWAATNVSNGVVPGVTYDAYSRALFKYPDVVVIDMTDATEKVIAAPNYRNIRNNEIEYTGPKNPALAGDNDAAVRRAKAFQQFELEEAYEAEREERKSMYDPGVKK